MHSYLIKQAQWYGFFDELAKLAYTPPVSNIPGFQTFIDRTDIPGSVLALDRLKNSVLRNPNLKSSGVMPRNLGQTQVLRPEQEVHSWTRPAPNPMPQQLQGNRPFLPSNKPLGDPVIPYENTAVVKSTELDKWRARKKAVSATTGTSIGNVAPAVHPVSRVAPATAQAASKPVLSLAGQAASKAAPAGVAAVKNVGATRGLWGTLGRKASKVGRFLARAV